MHIDINVTHAWSHINTNLCSRSTSLTESNGPLESERIPSNPIRYSAAYSYFAAQEKG
jgi:hypothetical protein